MKLYFLLILFTQNNIFLTLTNFKGDVLFWNSLGRFKNKGLKKLTNSFIKNFIYVSLKKLNTNSRLKIHVRTKGFNKCKKLFLKTLFTLIPEVILSVTDNSLDSLNGCKLKKRRRL
uniref:Ribosomal protein S11 n=1 Tax=Melanothamnus gigas TaxID=3016206 RepID=A0A9F1UD89_9FLOR|nr:Ribosomal protein S11 [Melanothamnus gigas]WAX04167.1 Ribosomal protein S11 [Melanothamnus gigas]